MNRSEFEAELKRDGYEVKESELGPMEPKPQHTHDFDARVFVLDGEITIVTGDKSTTYRKGDDYSLAAGTMHTEVVGPGSVKYVAGRR
tara:strand:- start:1614 stop:1877 length:264 start_codon:yes stop_codon:yes gene_type:complete